MTKFIAFLSTALLCALPPSLAIAQQAMVKVACVGLAKEGLVRLNGQVKGNCPIDVGVKPGNHVLTVTQNINGAPVVYTSKFFVGADTIKTIDVVLPDKKASSSRTGTATATPTEPMPQADPNLIARKRYAAQLEERKRNISTCLPRYADVWRQLQQDYAEAKRVYNAGCVAVWGPGDPDCGAGRGANTPENWRRYSDAKEKISEQYLSYDQHAEMWCAKQFPAPIEPN